jgi:hypothetical protein
MTVVALTALFMFASGQSAIDTELASLYIDQYRAAAKLDGGRLWGKSLLAPLLFVDPTTRTVVASQADTDLALTPKDSVFLGTLPANKLLGNAILDWGRTQWVMILWPVPENYTDRMTLLLHESFHRIQPSLGFLRQGDPCNHLNTLDGRYWMQLEWRALARALRKTGSERREAIRDATLFRRRRYELFPDAQVAEARMERLEGVPSYTGTKLRGTADVESLLHVAQRLEDAVSNTENLPRMFSYLTGPAHGFLLDGSGSDWKKSAATTPGFGEAVATAYQVRLEGNVKQQAETAASRYGGKSLLAAEKSRDKKIRERIASFEQQLVKGPVLELSMGSWRASTNALKMTPIGVGRVVHTYLVANSDWGRLEVDGSHALVDETSRLAYVPMPFRESGDSLIGTGWKVFLNTGWKVVNGTRRGDMKVVKSGATDCSNQWPF